MKSCIIYAGSFLFIFFVSFYQGCQQSDHITCFTYEGITLSSFDISSAEFKLLKEGDEVFARKFAFSFEPVTAQTICLYRTPNIMNCAYAFTRYYNDNIFIKDTINEVEIYCVQAFNSQYPSGSVLNNLFEIPILNSTNYYNNYQNSSLLIVLNEIPAQTDFYKFYINVKTKENKIFVDSLPTIKIKI